jgi:hypothetical protein
MGSGKEDRLRRQRVEMMGRRSKFVLFKSCREPIAEHGINLLNIREVTSYYRGEGESEIFFTDLSGTKKSYTVEAAIAVEILKVWKEYEETSNG